MYFLDGSLAFLSIITMYYRQQMRISCVLYHAMLALEILTKITDAKAFGWKLGNQLYCLGVDWRN